MVSIGVGVVVGTADGVTVSVGAVNSDIIFEVNKLGIGVGVGAIVGASVGVASTSEVGKGSGLMVGSGFIVGVGL